MGYPGDQGKPGGWPPEQPPQEPYGPGAGQAEPAPYGAGKDEAPFAPRAGAFEGAGGGNSPWGEDAAGRTAPAPGGAFGGDSFGQEPFGQGSHGAGPGPGGDRGFGDGGYDAQTDGRFGQDGFDGDRGGPTPPGRRRNMPLIIGGALAAGLVLIGGGFGVSAMLKDDPAPKKGADPSAAQGQTPAAKPSPTAPALDPVKLKSRATDRQPLALNEVFSKASFKAGGQKYVRAGWKATKGCTGTVTGTKLATAVKKGGCSQAMRATFARSDGKLIGTVGVLNLKTEAAAKLAQRAAAAKDSFLQPLPGAGSTKTIGKGEALGTAETRGHYLVMTWVQRPDGKKIPAASHKTVSAFGQHVIKGSNLSFALHYRETEGKPFRN